MWIKRSDTVYSKIYSVFQSYTKKLKGVRKYAVDVIYHYFIELQSVGQRKIFIWTEMTGKKLKSPNPLENVFKITQFRFLFLDLSPNWIQMIELIWKLLMSPMTNILEYFFWTWRILIYMMMGLFSLCKWFDTFR